MSTALTDRAPAKINLTLRVTGRRADGYHLLESLVAFADIADHLTLEPGGPARLDVDGLYAVASGPASGNLVLKAAAAFAQTFGGQGGAFRLTKHIPVAAGLGGGSADAAAALRLLARANGMTVDEPRLMDIARRIGADVPVCVSPRARMMRGIGDELSPPAGLPPLPALLVNPGVACATRDVFAAFRPSVSRGLTVGEVPRDRAALLDWLMQYGNDLTPAAIATAPVIVDVIAELNGFEGARIARMSGSGATCFALFDTMDAARRAARELLARRSNWWIAAAALD